MNFEKQSWNNFWEGNDSSDIDEKHAKSAGKYSINIFKDICKEIMNMFRWSEQEQKETSLADRYPVNMPEDDNK